MKGVMIRGAAVLLLLGAGAGFSAAQEASDQQGDGEPLKPITTGESRASEGPSLEEELIFPGQLLLIEPPGRNEIIAAVPEPEVSLPSGMLPEPEWGNVQIPEEAWEPAWGTDDAAGEEEQELPLGLDLFLGGGSRLYLTTGFALYQYSGEDRFRLAGEYESFTGFWDGESWGEGETDFQQSLQLEGEGASWRAGYSLDRRGYQGLNPGRDSQDLHRLIGRFRFGEADSRAGVALEGGWQGLFIRGDRNAADQGLWLRPSADWSAGLAGGEASAEAVLQADFREGEGLAEVGRLPGRLEAGWKSGGEADWLFSLRGGGAGILARRYGLPWEAAVEWTPEAEYSARLAGGYRWEILPVLGAGFDGTDGWDPYTLFPDDDQTLEAWAAGLSGSWRVGGGLSLEAGEHLYLWERRPTVRWDSGEGLWQPETEVPGEGQTGLPWSWESRISGRWSRFEAAEVLLAWTSRLGESWMGLPRQELTGEMSWRRELPGQTAGGISGQGSWRWYGGGDGRNDWPLVSLGGWWTPDPAVEVRLDTEDWLSLADSDGRTFQNVYQEPGFRVTLRVQISL